MKTFEVDAECEVCGGTGLYIGMGESGGAAVICGRCKGKGHYLHTLNWNEFSGRKVKKGVKRVYETNPGIGIGEGPDRKGNIYKLEDFGGMPYSDWKEGKPFPPKSENRNYTCPAWWYQSANYELKPRWDECIFGGTFSSCKHFGAKQKCWKKWDKEYGQENTSSSENGEEKHK